jgi:hypothetical protein
MTDWQWYWCDHVELERCHGPCDSREAAIAAGRAESDGAPFYVVEAVREVLRLPGGDRLIELIMDENEDLWDPDGDPPDLCGTTDEIKAAEAALSQAVVDWFEKHGSVLPSGWLFAKTLNQKEIDRKEQG